LRDRVDLGAAPNGRNSARRGVLPNRDPCVYGASFAASSPVFVAPISSGSLLRAAENDPSFPCLHGLAHIFDGAGAAGARIKFPSARKWELNPKIK